MDEKSCLSPRGNHMISRISDKRLRYFNIGAMILHAVQGILMLIASQAVDSIKKGGSKTVVYRYLECVKNETTGDDCIQPVSLVVKSKDVGNMEIGLIAAIFLLMSAAAHALVLVFFRKYVNDINRGINVFRWYEYALSSSVMIIGIAILFGMNDVASLLLLFSVNCVMNLFGLLMERINVGTSKSEVNWEPFFFGCVAGIAPWISIGIYFFGGDLSSVPGFVFGILFSYFFFFNTFPVNMFLQYRKIGWWADYRVGEVVYQILSLASKSLLAYLVFGGTFSPNDSN